MTITFSVRSDAQITAKPAVVTARQLAAFRSFARAQGHLVGMFDDPDFGYLAYGFEARVCPCSWAAIARLFGDSEAVIAVVEEAQFLGLNVRFWKDAETAAIMMAVAHSPDGSRSLDLPDEPAGTLLESVGLASKWVGDLDLAELARCIGDPATRRYLERSGLADTLQHLDALGELRHNDIRRLVWA